MLHFVNGIFLCQHPPELDKGCDGKNAPNHPVQDMLVIIDLFGDEEAPKNEYTIPDKSADPDAEDIGIIMI